MTSPAMASCAHGWWPSTGIRWRRYQLSQAAERPSSLASSGHIARGPALATASFLAAAAAAHCLRGRHLQKTRRLVSAREPPPRPPKEEPTAFPRDKLFPPAVFDLLVLFTQDQPDLQELMDGLEEFQYLHQSDRNWGKFPAHVADVPDVAYNRGIFKLVRGIMKCAEQERSSELRFVAIDTLHAILLGGCNYTKCPPTFFVEMGCVGMLCKICQENTDTAILEMILEISRMAPAEMLPLVIENGAIEPCIKILEDDGSHPMEQLTALELLQSLSKRAPGPLISAGVYEAVQLVENPVLVSRRNKILKLLRPLVQLEATGTDIRQMA
eukprot:TRINITY_DN12660_c0_g1_i1.p1 TRINITY_DN12660_c0_g1~~TRINITY_DN12660_c0_g1_i1.p1  ORF type:complete len:335 (-),score=61.27 TRINITY_DN12660_c0_g1_i1:57-1037(-)